MSISAELIQEVVARMDALPDDESLDALVEQFADEQPFVFAFLMTMGEDDFNDDEAELFLSLGLNVWEIMKSYKGSLPAISEAQLEVVEDDNRDLLDALAAESDAGFWTATEQVVADSDQPALLAYLVETIMDESFFVRPGNRASLFFFTKIIVDCFDQL
ncbi:MAG: hypothetical protein OHK0039_16550 [Bacteroidia bacterium]